MLLTPIFEEGRDTWWIYRELYYFTLNSGVFDVVLDEVLVIRRLGRFGTNRVQKGPSVVVCMCYVIVIVVVVIVVVFSHGCNKG